MSTAVKHSDAIAEAVRDLNHATRSRDAYEFPSDVARVIADLETAASRMSQAIDQAAAWLERAHAAGQIGHDKEPTADRAVPRAVDLLRTFAMSSAHALADELADAHVVTAHLTGTA